MINKEKNINLQLTISKESYQKLELIINELSKGQIIALNKSKTIEFLINEYRLKNNEQERQKAEIKNEKKADYVRRIRLLMMKLNLSVNKLADLLTINRSTFKKYAYGTNEPTNENKIILENAFKKYGIE